MAQRAIGRGVLPDELHDPPRREAIRVLGAAIHQIDDRAAELRVFQVGAKDVHLRQAERMGLATKILLCHGVFAVRTFVFRHRDLFEVDPAEVAIECFRLMVWNRDGGVWSIFAQSIQACSDELGRFGHVAFVNDELLDMAAVADFHGDKIGLGESVQVLATERDQC